MVSADFDSYYEAQRGIDARWQVVPAWTRASILNVARMPWFSSDRTIREYAEEIWNVPVRAAAAGGQRPARGEGVVSVPHGEEARSAVSNHEGRTYRSRSRPCETSAARLLRMRSERTHDLLHH